MNGNTQDGRLWTGMIPNTAWCGLSEKDTIQLEIPMNCYFSTLSLPFTMHFPQVAPSLSHLKKKRFCLNCTTSLISSSFPIYDLKVPKVMIILRDQDQDCMWSCLRSEISNSKYWKSCSSCVRVCIVIVEKRALRQNSSAMTWYCIAHHTLMFPHFSNASTDSHNLLSSIQASPKWCNILLYIMRLQTSTKKKSEQLSLLLYDANIICFSPFWCDMPSTEQCQNLR